MKGKKKYTRNIVFTAIALLCAFLALPVMFPDDAALAGKKLGLGSAIDGQGEALPVVFTDNPLSKYFKKLSKFYNLGKHNNAAPSFEENPLFAYNTDDYYIPASEGQNGVFVFDEEPADKPSDVYAAQDGTPVRPQADGYYYGDKYYANGKYPSDGLKKSIEGAISRYHAAAAAKDGKKAVYMQKEDGSMHVEYVDQGAYNKYLSTGVLGNSEEEQSLMASSERYSGARIASKGSSSAKDLSFSANSASHSSGEDMNGGFGAFDTIAAKISASGKKAEDLKKEEEEKEKEDFNKKTNNLMASSQLFSRSLFPEPARNPKSVRVPYIEHSQEYNGKKLLYDQKLVNLYLSKFNIQSQDIPKNSAVVQLSPDFSERDERGERKQINVKQNIVNALGGENTFKIITMPLESRNVIDAVGHMKEQNKNGFVAFLSAPQNDYTAKPQDRKSFTDTFFVDTGIENMLRTLEVSDQKIDAIRAQYKAIDEANQGGMESMRKHLAEIKSLKNLKPSSTIYLGKDRNGNPMIATPRSYIYRYATPAPQWVQERFANDDAARAYLPVDKNLLASHLKDPLNVLVVTNNRDRDNAAALGAKIVVVGKMDDFTPEVIRENAKNIREASILAASRLASVPEQQKIAQLKKDLDKGLGTVPFIAPVKNTNAKNTTGTKKTDNKATGVLSPTKPQPKDYVADILKNNPFVSQEKKTDVKKFTYPFR